MRCSWATSSLCRQAGGASMLIKSPSGATAWCVQVGRTGEPLQDGSKLAAIQQAVGSSVVLRADANRLFSLEQALAFAQQLHLDNVELEYLEEPVSDPVSDLGRFAAETGLPVALDESLDDGVLAAPMLEPPARGSIGLDGVSALIIKPSLLGSLERTCALLRWSAARGVGCTVSSAFDSSVGLCKLAGIALAADACDGGATAARSHGLGTLSWFAADATDAPLQLAPLPDAGSSGPAGVGCSVEAIAHTEAAALKSFAASGEQGSRTETLAVVVPGPEAAAYRVHALRADAVAAGSNGAAPAAPQCAAEPPAVLLLHGFMGCAEDWAPALAALPHLGVDCAAVDLAGHGATASDGAVTAELDLKHMCGFVKETVTALGWGSRRVTVVGYSLGARVAMQVAATGSEGVFDRVVAVSGSPGIQGVEAARARLQKDVQTAAALRQMPLPAFLELWYEAPLWSSLRRHPRFAAMLRGRAAQADTAALAAVLEGCSPGKQNLWAALKGGSTVCDVALVVGEQDSKFVGVAQALVGANDGLDAPARGGVRVWEGSGPCRVASIVGAGHAVHTEQPLALVRALAALLQL